MPVHHLPEAVFWLEEAARFSIRGGIACCTVKTGKESIELRASVATLLASLRNGTTAYAQFVGGEVAEVVRLPKRKRTKG